MAAKTKSVSFRTTEAGYTKINDEVGGPARKAGFTPEQTQLYRALLAEAVKTPRVVQAAAARVLAECQADEL